jgi:MFS family permease
MKSEKYRFSKDLQYYKFCLYGFLKNLRFYEPFLFLYLLDFQLSFLQIGLLFSAREITRNLFEIPAGIFSDALGRKRTMIISFSFYILSFVVFFFSELYFMFMAAMVIYSLGDAFRTGTHKAMIFDYLKMNQWADQKVFYYGHTRSWSQFGSAMSALTAAVLVFFSDGYRYIFLYSIIPYLLDLMLIASYPKSLDGEIALTVKNSMISNIKQVFKDFLLSILNLKVLRAISNLSVHTGYYTAMKDYLQPVLQTLALSLPIFFSFDDDQRTALLIGCVYFLIFLSTSFSSRYAGEFASRFNSLKKPLNLTLMGGIAGGLLSGLFYHTGFYFLSVVCYVLIYVNENLRKPIGISYVAENIETRILSTVLSAESQIHALFAAVMAPALGFFADLWGVGVSLMMVAGILIMFSPFYLTKKYNN